jgi:hypothetical protein
MDLRAHLLEEVATALPRSRRPLPRILLSPKNLTGFRTKQLGVTHIDRNGADTWVARMLKPVRSCSERHKMTEGVVYYCERMMESPARASPLAHSLLWIFLPLNKE